MFPRDFYKIRSELKIVYSETSTPVVKFIGTSVSYVPFSSDGVALSVAKAVPFEPINVSFRAYDTELILKMSQCPVQTYRGDALNLITELSNI